MMQDNFVKEGLAVKFIPAADPINPRTSSDCNTSVLALSHRRYKLGDAGHPYDTREYHGWEAMKASIVSNENPLVIKPVYMMDHSGLSISTKPFSCSWDSGQVGWAYVPASSTLTAEQAESALDAELEEYGAYLSGDLYDVCVEAPLSGEPLLEEYSMSREAAEASVTAFFSARAAGGAQ